MIYLTTFYAIVKTQDINASLSILRFIFQSCKSSQIIPFHSNTYVMSHIARSLQQIKANSQAFNSPRKYERQRLARNEGQHLSQDAINQETTDKNREKGLYKVLLQESCRAAQIL